MWVPGRDALEGIHSATLVLDTQESWTVAPSTPSAPSAVLLSCKSCWLLSLISISLETPQEHTLPDRFVVRIGSLALAQIFFIAAKMF